MMRSNYFVFKSLNEPKLFDKVFVGVVIGVVPDVTNDFAVVDVLTRCCCWPS
jgi:hypothetical protein